MPPALKAFLLALAIIDDLGAIIIIALFYASELSMPALALASHRRRRADRAEQKRRVADLALSCGRISALAVRAEIRRTRDARRRVHGALHPDDARPRADHDNPLERLEHALSPWVSFGIVPIFAFANAGVSLAGMSPAAILTPIPLGIALGLFFGKLIGVYGTARLAIAGGLGAMPAGSTQTQLLGAAVLAGIGFTMSLFIGMLAFPDPSYSDELRIGVLVGSTISAIVGYTILRNASPMRVMQ